ncbi:uncharacterized protein LOC120637053 isoform X1 [Pararge aegeria]|uniref:Jg19798 protein n=1 Tax=Pararge aegeria aegeria TaxID=348720 RepID=A0A8S4SB19_9NEOP|nr:uncharacterized protein LOC120637053 isoform X1 [Pararge aegeria]CAH2265279.1 jg19798 [Pararge aegeria aegeria]
MADGNKDNTKGDEKDKRVKIQVEGEDEIGAEGETGRRKMKRFQLPNLSRWWQAKIIQYAFAHPHVRARLEKHMGSNLVRLTDKTYMTELEERIRAVNEENLNKRISSRVLDEMERLKRLILVGKTPLKECPPELFHHPVFVFWRMVNREVARASKKRADAYYRKLKASQKIDQGADEEAEAEALSEQGHQLTPEELLAKCVAELEEIKQADIEKGVRFNDEQFTVLKYEANDIKVLKNLTTVEELYALADKIIGTKRL